MSDAEHDPEATFDVVASGQLAEARIALTSELTALAHRLRASGLPDQRRALRALARLPSPGEPRGAHPAQELESLEATRENPRVKVRLAKVEAALGRPPASRRVLSLHGAQGEIFEL